MYLAPIPHGTLSPAPRRDRCRTRKPRFLGYGSLGAMLVCAIPPSSASAEAFLQGAKPRQAARTRHRGLFQPNHPRVVELFAQLSHGHRDNSGDAIALTLARAVASLEGSHGIRLDTDIMVSKQPFQRPSEPHILTTAEKVKGDRKAMTEARRRVKWILAGPEHEGVRKVLRFLIDSSTRELDRNLAASERGEGHRLLDPAPLNTLWIEMTRRTWEATHTAAKTWGGFLNDLFNTLADQGRDGQSKGQLAR